MKVARKYFQLFENESRKELIYVLYEDLGGYIHYRYCDDPTEQEYKMTQAQLYSGYEQMTAAKKVER